MVNEKQLTDLLHRCNYKYKDLTKRDVKQALESFNELSFSCENYVFPNGSYKDLVSLNGTIPVVIKNQRYNIPVQIYLSDTHPYQAPICYVRPTPDMTINNRSKSVDQNGRVSLPCLSEWRYPPSDIYFLLNMMAIQFGEETPLFAKTAASSMARPGSSSSMSGPTPYPQYPAAAANTTPYPSQPVYPSSSASQPPYPTYPSASGSSQPPPYPPGGSGTASASVNPYYPFGMPVPTFVNSGGPNVVGGGGGNNFGQTRPTLNSTPLNAGSYADDTIKPEYYKMSLVSAVVDKYRIRSNETNESRRAEIDSLMRVKNDLQQSERQLNTYISEGQSELLSVGEMTQELRKKTAQLNENVNKIQHRDQANIEDAVVTTTPLYRQLMQSYAEEMAIQDLIFYLSEGLMHKSVSLESFLKQVRLLSRKQFMLRATMQKAREKASLPI